MKKIINLSSWLMVLSFIGAITFSSCQKEVSSSVPQDDPQELSNTQTVSNDDAEEETEFDDVFNITMDVKAADVGDDIGLGDGTSSIYGRSMEGGRGV